jgi:hypothetical protein
MVRAMIKLTVPKRYLDTEDICCGNSHDHQCVSIYGEVKIRLYRILEEF